MSSKSIKRGSVRDRAGRKWEVALVPSDEADDEDFRFWYEGLSGAERVEAVHECLLSTLSTRGIHGAPRLRRTARRIQRRQS